MHQNQTSRAEVRSLIVFPHTAYKCILLHVWTKTKFSIFKYLPVTRSFIGMFQFYFWEIPAKRDFGFTTCGKQCLKSHSRHGHNKTHPPFLSFQIPTLRYNSLWFIFFLKEFNALPPAQITKKCISFFSDDTVWWPRSVASNTVFLLLGCYLFGKLYKWSLSIFRSKK